MAVACADTLKVLPMSSKLWRPGLALVTAFRKACCGSKKWEANIFASASMMTAPHVGLITLAGMDPIEDFLGFW